MNKEIDIYIIYCTKWYGNLRTQQLIFPVNEPFVCSWLGLICLNLISFTCFGRFKIQNYRFCTLHWSDQILYRALEFATASEKNYTALHQYKKISAAVANSSAQYKI